MRTELAEACGCDDRARPGYWKYGHQLCLRCERYRIKPLRRKRLLRVRALKSGPGVRIGGIVAKAKARADAKAAEQ